MRDFLTSKFRESFLVALIIVLTLSRIVYLFAFEKTGEHSDEIWSYGLSNSYYKPFIYMDDDRQEYVNLNAWTTGDELHNYITVQDNQKFEYGSVTYNLKHDFHPPFYFYILHTISSFFPNQYSRWFAFAINIAVFPVLMIYLYLLAKKLCKSTDHEKLLPVLIIIFYGIASAGVSTFVFARHYAMLTMFAVMYAYYLVRLIESSVPGPEEKKTGGISWKYIVILLVISIFGCLTQYFFASYAFIVTVMMTIYYLSKKRFGQLIAFDGAMLISVLPLFAITGVLNSTSDRADIDGMQGLGLPNRLANFFAPDNFFIKVKTCVECFLYDFLGIKLPNYMSYYISVIGATLLLIVIIAIPALVLYISKNKNKIKEKLLSCLRAIKEMSDRNYILLTLSISVLFSIYAYCILSGTDNMEALTNRYMFIVYPIFAVLLVLLLNWVKNVIGLLIVKLIGFVIRIIKGNKDKDCAHKNDKMPIIRKVCSGVISGIIVIAIMLGIHDTKIYYLFPRVENEIKIEQLVEDKDVILVMTEQWLLTCYTDILQNADDICVARTRTYKEQIPDLYREKFESGYLVMDVSKMIEGVLFTQSFDTDEELIEAVSNKFLPFFRGVFPDKEIKYVQQDEIFTRNVYIYEIN